MHMNFGLLVVIGLLIYGIDATLPPSTIPETPKLGKANKQHLADAGTVKKDVTGNAGVKNTTTLPSGNPSVLHTTSSTSINATVRSNTTTLPSGNPSVFHTTSSTSINATVRSRVNESVASKKQDATTTPATPDSPTAPHTPAAELLTTVKVVTTTTNHPELHVTPKATDAKTTAEAPKVTERPKTEIPQVTVTAKVPVAPKVKTVTTKVTTETLKVTTETPKVTEAPVTEVPPVTEAPSLVTEAPVPDVPPATEAPATVPEIPNLPPVDLNPVEEEASGSNFPILFMVSILAIVGGYFLYHNKSKILGLLIEGRGAQTRRSGPRYNRLKNVEEAMPGMKNKISA